MLLVFGGDVDRKFYECDECFLLFYEKGNIDSFVWVLLCL